MTIKPCGCDIRYVDERTGHAPECVYFPKRRRGFAALSPEQLRGISSSGGRAAHAKGKAHEFTSEEAKEAGRKGGHATARKLAAERQSSER